MNTLLLGLVTGAAFGFFLQRSRVLRYNVQIAALRLMDMAIVKFMLTFVAVAMVGTYLLVGLGMAQLHVKTAVLGLNIVGGLLFGAGWGLLGYCPGTAVGAVGEGRLDALWGIAGMLVGAGGYAEVYPAVQTALGSMGDLGKLTLPELFGVSPWIVIAALLIAIFALFRFLEARRL